MSTVEYVTILHPSLCTMVVAMGPTRQEFHHSLGCIKLSCVVVLQGDAIIILFSIKGRGCVALFANSLMFNHQLSKNGVTIA